MDATVIEKALANKRARARRDYFSALRAARSNLDDDAATKIASLAELAGISSAQIEEHVGILNRATGLAVSAKNLPNLAKKHGAARTALEQAEAELLRVRGPLEAAVDAAAFEAAQLEESVRQSRAAVAELVGLVNGEPELLADFRTVPAVRESIDAETRRKTAASFELAKSQKLADARRRVTEAQRLVHRIQTGTWPFDEHMENGRGGAIVDTRQAERALADGSALKNAQQQLADAEKEFKAVESEGAPGE